MNKLTSLILLIVVLIGCNNNTNTTNENPISTDTGNTTDFSNTDSKESTFDFKSFPKGWVQLTEVDKKMAVLRNCDAVNLTLYFTENDNNQPVIVLDGPQDDMGFDVESYSQPNDTIIFTVKEKDSRNLQYFKFIWTDKEKGLGYWIIPGWSTEAIFVVSGKQLDYPVVYCDDEDGEEPYPVISEYKLKDNVSNKFQYYLQFLSKGEENNKLKISIYNKETSEVQEIYYQPRCIFDFESLCSEVSYFKNNKKIDEGLEGHHNFIIADYNFDGLEDFAILKDVGGGGGSWFTYFFQDKYGKFREDNFFPLNDVSSFPFEINPKDKTIKIGHPVGAMKAWSAVFQLKDEGWEMIHSETEDFTH